MTDSRLEEDKVADSPPRRVYGGGGGSGGVQTQTSSVGSSHEAPPGYPASYSAALAIPAMLSSLVPPSGSRILLSARGGPAFPGMERTRGAPFMEPGAPIYSVFIGSAYLQDSVRPCKIVLNSGESCCYLVYGGIEIRHDGLYDLLPFVPDHMEYVLTSGGYIPPGRQPVKGGFESDGRELYHAAALVQGIKVPGETGLHINGCRIPFHGQHVVIGNYEILCWKF